MSALQIQLRFKSLYYPLGAICFAASSKHTTTTSKKRKNIQHMSFKSLITAGTNESLHLLVLHLWSTYLRLEGSNLKSLCKGWSGYARISLALVNDFSLSSSERPFRAVPTIFLHTLTISKILFLFLHVERPNQQMKLKVNKDSIKQA